MPIIRKSLSSLLVIGSILLGAGVAGAAEFSTIDTDASGGLSLQEIQAVAPEFTVEEFTTYDVDGSGELSELEFTDWKNAQEDDDNPEDASFNR